MLRSAFSSISRNVKGTSEISCIRTLATSSVDRKDLTTHTGQAWEADDYRNARFMNVPKLVNTKFAIDLIQKVPPVAVDGNIAVCEGGPSEALGHPKIYINLDQPGNHDCSYCGIRFYKKGKEAQ